jgi:hypothetical protein
MRSPRESDIGIIGGVREEVAFFKTTTCVSLSPRLQNWTTTTEEEEPMMRFELEQFMVGLREWVVVN